MFKRMDIFKAEAGVVLDVVYNIVDWRLVSVSVGDRRAQEGVLWPVWRQVWNQVWEVGHVRR